MEVDGAALWSAAGAERALDPPSGSGQKYPGHLTLACGIGIRNFHIHIRQAKPLAGTPNDRRTDPLSSRRADAKCRPMHL